MVAKIKNPTKMTVSSFATYNSLEMAMAERPVPKVTQPVLEIKELPGRASRMEEALAEGEGEGSEGEEIGREDD